MTNTAEANLQRLASTSIVADFVKANQGEWDHQTWVNFCHELGDKGFFPIDLDQVGLLLERRKADYWTSLGR